MPVVTDVTQGSPTWLDLSTTDEKAAIEFYGSLFGWTNESNDVGNGVYYHMQKQGEAYVCGIFQQQEEQVGMPPCWNTYIAVDDADEVAAKVAPAGGQVYQEPFDVFDAGRTAVIADPTGGVVMLWQNKQGTGGTLVGEPNSRCWSELMTDDPDKALSFFETVLGVERSEVPGPGGMRYHLIKAGGTEVAGVIEKTPEMGMDMPVHWLNYFAVADCDATVEKAKSLGGSLLAGPMDVMPGRFAVLADGQGVSFGVIQLNEPS